MANNPRPEDFHRRFVEAFNSADVQPLLDLYEPDASLVPQPDEVVSDTKRSPKRSASSKPSGP